MICLCKSLGYGVFLLIVSMVMVPEGQGACWGEESHLPCPPCSMAWHHMGSVNVLGQGSSEMLIELAWDLAEYVF